MVEPPPSPHDLIADIVESAPDAILLVDTAGRIVFANPAAEVLFGYRREELVGEGVELLVPARLRAGHTAERERYAAAPAWRPMETRSDLVAVRKDGSEFPVGVSLNSARGRAGGLTVAFARDLTEQRRLDQERARLAQSAELAEIVSGLGAVVWYSATPGRERLSFVGGREAALLGYTRDDWLADGFWAGIVHPADLARATTFLDARPATEHFELEYRAFAADGDVRHLRDVVVVARRPDGGVERLTGVIVDVTEQREVEERMRTAQKMEAVGELAGGIAHDFNNLLTIVSGRAHLLVQRPELAAVRDELAQIVAATERGSELTAQLLAFAHGGTRPVEPIEPNAVIRGILGMLRRLVGEDVAFDVELSETAPPIRIDPVLLEQLLTNLVLNARDAMPGGGLLTVGTGLEDGCLRLRVADTGTGMPEAVRARVFEPFFSTKRPGKGTGMGLATAYSIVTRAGGLIEVDSQVGAGTTFSIRLPAASPGADGGGLPPVVPTRPTVLVVDDEPAIRSLLVEILEADGCEVLAAANGAEAVLLASRHLERLDAVVSDVVMPELSGPELVERLRPLRPDLPILFVSGYNDSRLVTSGMAALAIPVLYKPFRPDELAARVRELIADGDGSAP